mmetsp:Transcript_881/g.2017  ORF Transcript_881/g.2017 Transcript_881/m.2017 type:complete len:619 (-) Transcript_881:14-1870(-)
MPPAYIGCQRLSSSALKCRLRQHDAAGARGASLLRCCLLAISAALVAKHCLFVGPLQSPLKPQEGDTSTRNVAAGNLLKPGTTGQEAWQRRKALALLGVGNLALTPEGAHAAETPFRVSAPLRYCGGGFCTFFEVDGRRFRGVVDTGSPFILLSTCDRETMNCAQYCRAWGCTNPLEGEASGLSDTTEIFAAGSTTVKWRKGGFGFGDANIGKVTYGIMLDTQSYGGNGGGAFLGLIRDKAERIRPTVLGQTTFRSLEVDLREPGQERLTLSDEPLARSADSIPLVDLRPMGAPVRYYSAEVRELRFGGERVSWPGRIIAVLDTGTTGLTVPPELFEFYDRMRRRKADELGLRAASRIEVDLATEGNGAMTLALRQGQVPAYGTTFDVVSANPEPDGMSADAEALWAAAPDKEALEIRGAVAKARDSTRPGLAQADSAITPGQSFKVKILPGSSSMIMDKFQRGSEPCSITVGLAPRGGPRDKVNLGSAEGTSALTSGALSGGDQVEKLYPGDVVECGLTDAGSAFWRVNGRAIALEKLDTKRLLFPSVETTATCGVELLEVPDGKLQWSAIASDVASTRGAGDKSESRPLILFCGLGFFIGRSLKIDAVDNRAVLLT